MIDLKKLTGEISDRFKDHPDKNEIVGVITGLVVKNTKSPWIKLDVNNLPPTGESYIVQRPNRYTQIPIADTLIGYLHAANPDGQPYGGPGNNKKLYTEYWSFPGVCQLTDVTHYIPVKYLRELMDQPNENIGN